MVNQVGGNDSLVFDGSSLVLNREGEVIAQGKSFEEDLVYFDSKTLTGEMHEQVAGDEASVYAALVLGTRDYMHKCGFREGDHRAERRHRFRSDRRHRRRCGRSRKCDRRGHAGTIFFARVRSTMPARWRRISAFASNCFPSTEAYEAYRDDAEKCLRRMQGRRDGRETSNRAPAARC